MKCKIVTKAIYEYTAQADEELSFKEGDILLITDDTDQDWWTAIEKPVDTFQEAQSGLVPVNYVEEVFFMVINCKVLLGSSSLDSNSTL